MDSQLGVCIDPVQGSRLRTRAFSPSTKLRTIPPRCARSSSRSSGDEVGPGPKGGAHLEYLVQGHQLASQRWVEDSGKGEGRRGTTNKEFFKTKCKKVKKDPKRQTIFGYTPHLKRTQLDPSRRSELPLVLTRSPVRQGRRSRVCR